MKLTAAMAMVVAVPGVGDESAARTMILDAARGPAEADLGKPVRFLVKRLERRDDWAFLLADMQNPQGRRVDFAGTKFAGAAREGMVSDSYAALLHRTEGHWAVVDHATGPTDVAWEGWAKKHAAPAELFAS